MATEVEGTETLATKTDTDIGLLLTEFRSCGSNGDFWSRQQTAEDTRLARWDSQSDDGKKWDKNQADGSSAFPWNGASDVRCYLADEIINESVATKLTAFWRSDVRVEGVEPDDMSGASSATTFMNWMRDNDLRKNLEEDVELSAQYEDWYGWTALHVTWDRQVSYRWRVLSMDALTQTANQFQQSGQIPQELQSLASNMIALPQLIQDPDREQFAIEAVQFLYRVYVKSQLPDDITDTDIPNLSISRARKITRELRKLGRSQVPFPYLCRNKPVITALKPWRDIVVPTDTTDLQSARAVFIRQFMTEAEVRSMELSAGWDADFVEAAIQTKGRLSVWSFANQGLLNPLFQWSFTQDKNNLIEIVTAYHKAVDDDGIPAVYYTLFSAHIAGADPVDTLIAKSGMLGGPHVDEYPIIISRRELLDRQIMSCRGIPEILLTAQREEKVLRDAMMDWCSIGVLPPMNVYKGAMGQRYRFAPAEQNLVTAGREPKLMEISATGPQFAVEYLQTLRSSVDHYFARPREDVLPQLTQMMLEPKIRRFLCAWSAALRLAYGMYHHYSPETFERITGDTIPDDDAENLDFIFHFDVAQLNPEIMEKKMAAFSALIPEDSGGVLDRNAIIQAKARMIDPALAKQLVMNKGAASQQLFDKVKTDLVGMSDGNEAGYTDAANDPTAQSRAQYLTQIVQNNVKYLMKLDPQVLQQIGVQIPPQLQQMQQQGGQGQADPVFSGLVAKYIQNLQMAVSQQQNKTIGRIGVQPGGPQA